LEILVSLVQEGYPDSPLSTRLRRPKITLIINNY
jgi:hypothetical protein